MRPSFGFSCANRVVAFIVYFDEEAERLPERIPDDVSIGPWETAISVERQPLLLKTNGPNSPRRLWHACVFVDCHSRRCPSANNVLLDELRARGWLDTALLSQGTANSCRVNVKKEECYVGMEMAAVTQHVATILAIRKTLENEGFKIHDITGCSQATRNMKTKLQQQSIRKAAEILTTGMEAAQRAIALGSSEVEVHSEHNMAMMRAGGEILPGVPISVSINSGGFTENRVSRRRIKGGDFVFVTSSGIFNRERVSCSRVFYVRPYTSFINRAPKEVSSQSLI